MSECVVRMEMPKGCWDCPCVNGEYGYCQADKEERQIEDTNERPSWCPIICQLPEGHGRLVDADAVESIIRKWFEYIKLNPDILLDGVKSLHTIVPAETERSET